MAASVNEELQERLLRGEQGPYTVEDYVEIPQDGVRFQLMRGWLVREPSPLEIHQRIVGNLYFLLRLWVDRNGVGKVYVAPFDALLSAKSVLQPDLLFISTERSGIITPANVKGAPDLVIEVLSQSTAKQDRVVKQSLYKEAGVSEMWLVDPDERRVELICLQRPDSPVSHYRNEQCISSPLLGNLDFTVDALFA